MLHFTSKKNFYLFIFTFLIIFLLLHFFVLSGFALLDYDSVHNLRILEEIHRGDWHNLFHHGSPLFYLFFSLFYLAFKDIYILLIINILITFLAIYFFCKSLKTNFGGAWIWLGSSLFVITGCHYFSIESLSLLTGSIFWYQLSIFLENKNSLNTSLSSLRTPYKKLLAIGLWAGLTWLVNYKFMVLLPFLVWGVWVVKPYKSFALFFKDISFIAIGFTIPILGLMFLGIMLGLRWYQYPATVLSIFAVSGKHNPTATEWTYYWKYLLNFENILLLFLIAGRFWTASKWKLHILEKYALIVVGGVLLVMTFVPKAPRGLVFVIPLLYLLGFQSFLIVKNHFLASRKARLVWIGVGLIALGVQAIRMYQNLYVYKQSSYAQAAQYLKSQKTEVVFTTLGMGIYPYLDKSIRMEVLRELSDTMKFSQFKGKKYLLYDVFCETANHQSLFALKKKKAVMTYPEKTLLVPSLYLEHSEYTGLSFGKSLEKQQQLRKEPFQLWLIPLP